MRPAAWSRVAPLSSSATCDHVSAHRLILPLGMRVLVQVIRIEERTDAGLYLPAGAKEAQDEAFYGKVIEVARDRPTTSELTENVSGVPHGAHVLFRKEAGVRVPWDDRLRLIDVKDILATVEEVNADEAHCPRRCRTCPRHHPARRSPGSPSST
ncbi:MAG: co-chaperone GroES [Deltaproteobacteria bacterium]|nr:MAG: co-chaperone GroES [Deltaproteobacteria bacterium]